MFVNVYDRFTSFYHTHEKTIDTLLEVGQVIAGLLALVVLVSLLGWSYAIAYATNWLDALVESSLGDSSAGEGLPELERSASLALSTSPLSSPLPNN